MLKVVVYWTSLKFLCQGNQKDFVLTDICATQYITCNMIKFYHRHYNTNTFVLLKHVIDSHSVMSFFSWSCGSSEHKLIYLPNYLGKYGKRQLIIQTGPSWNMRICRIELVHPIRSCVGRRTVTVTTYVFSVGIQFQLPLESVT